MLEMIKPASLPDQSSERYLDCVRETVEAALQSYFGRLIDCWLDKFAGKLSIHPTINHREVDKKSLSGQCARFSQELKQGLTLLGLDTNVQGSAYQDAVEHVYLTPNNNPCDVIIDPTIGQFILGHNHVFVGTRKQLRDIVLNQSGHHKPYTLSGHENNDPEVLFNIMWGTHSKPRSPFILGISTPTRKLEREGLNLRPEVPHR